MKTNIKNKFIVERFDLKNDNEVNLAEEDKINKYDSYQLALNFKKSKKIRQTEFNKAKRFESFNFQNSYKNQNYVANISTP